MSAGTNQERIQQNNTKLATLKTKADNLPEYQDIKPIYKTGNMTSYQVNVTNRESQYQKEYWRFWNYKDVLIMVSYGTTYIDFYYKNQLVSTVTRGVSMDAYGCILKTSDTYCIFCVNNASIYTTKFKAFKIDWSNEENVVVTDLGLISNFPSSSGWISAPDGTMAQSASTTLYRYNESTNSLKSYISISKYFNYTGIPEIAFSSDYIVKYQYLPNNDTYTYIVKSGLSGINSVNYYATKVFKDGNIYALNSDLSIGELLKENAYVLPTSCYIYWLDNSHVYIGPKSITSSSGLVYEFNEETNELIKLPVPSRGWTFIGDYYTFPAVCERNSYKFTRYSWEDSTYEVGFYKDGNPYYYLGRDDVNFSSDSILEGNLAYNGAFESVTGTMPNNGALNITPSTSSQSIPAGYTSGGTISAVTSDIDSNISAGNIKDGVTILGVEGTYEGDYSGTISPAEYDEALETTEDILNGEPEPTEVQTYYEIEYD